MIFKHKKYCNGGDNSWRELCSTRHTNNTKVFDKFFEIKLKFKMNKPRTQTLISHSMKMLCLEVYVKWQYQTPFLIEKS